MATPLFSSPLLGGVVPYHSFSLYILVYESNKKSRGCPLASTLSTNQLLVVYSIIFLFWWLFHLLFLFFFCGLTCHLFLFTTLVEWFYCFICFSLFYFFRCACHLLLYFFPHSHTTYFSTKAEKNTTTQGVGKTR